MAMNQNIMKFYSEAASRDFLRDINFRIVGLKFRGKDIISEGDLLYGKGGQLPGRKVENIPVNYLGLQFNVAGTTSYEGSDSYKITFRCDATANVRTKLENMVRYIYNDQTSTGDYNIAGENSVMTLALLDKNLGTLREIELVGVDLRSVDSMEFKMDGKGDVMEMGTTWSFHFYRYGDLSKLILQASIPAIGGIEIKI